MFNQLILKELARQIKLMPCSNEQKADEQYMSDIKEVLAVLELSPAILFDSVQLMNKERIKIKKYQKAELTQDPLIDLILEDYENYISYVHSIELPIPQSVSDQYQLLIKCRDSVIKVLQKYKTIQEAIIEAQEKAEKESPIILLS